MPFWPEQNRHLYDIQGNSSNICCFNLEKNTQAILFVDLKDFVMIFWIVDCWFAQFFVDVDFPQKNDCWCWQIGQKNCNQHLWGPSYVPPLKSNVCKLGQVATWALKKEPF